MTHPPSNIGLSGAHRTGKTTVAQTISAQTTIPFLYTNTSEIMRRAGVDPTLRMPFATRLRVQLRILEAYEELFQTQPPPFITDRTPIDLMAYTLADITSSTEADFTALKHYLDRCFAVANEVFETIVIIQPGIPLIKASGKAALNPAYIEHLNTLILGLCYDPRNSSSILVLNRAMTNLDTRAAMIIKHTSFATARRPLLRLRV